MPVKPMDKEQLEARAREFHNTYERLAPQFGYETRPDTKAFDPTSPNGRLMMAVIGELESFPARELAATAERLEAANAELETAWQLNNRKAHSLFELQADFDAETLRRIDAEKVIDHYGDERHWVHRTVEDYNFSEIDSIFTEKHRTEYGFEKAQQYRKLYPINQEATDAK